MIRRLLLSANSLLPSAAKKLVPRRLIDTLKRWTIPNYSDITGFPHRVWLHDTAIPAIIAARPRRVIFAGLASYTTFYNSLFPRRDVEFITIDPEPRAACWGSPMHIVARADELEAFVRPGSVDAIIYVGHLWLWSRSRPARACQAS